MADRHPDQATPARAEAAFGFLAELGFHLADRHVTGGKLFRDGWRLIYASPGLKLTVQYLDTQFQVLFDRGGIETDYLFIDRELFGQRSGLDGNMFRPQNLAPIIELVAADIRDHFGSVLRGDDTEWARIQRLLDAPRPKARVR